MPIRHSSENERTGEGGAIPGIKERDRKTLAVRKSGNNSNNHWRFRCSWQRFQNIDGKIADGELLRPH